MSPTETEAEYLTERLTQAAFDHLLDVASKAVASEGGKDPAETLRRTLAQLLRAFALIRGVADVDAIGWPELAGLAIERFGNQAGDTPNATTP